MEEQEQLPARIPGSTFDVLGEEYRNVPPSEMMVEFVRARSRRALNRVEEDFEDRVTAADITAYQRRLREQFIEAIGGFPERVSLDAVETDRFRTGPVTVELVRFKSQPNHHVTGTVYVPDASSFSPPYPAVAVACGHASEGKANEKYQRVGELLARNGILGLVFDPLCQGERYQVVDDEGVPTYGSPTGGHMRIGVGSLPLGRNTARFEIWDGMRAIDYLVSRPDVDGDLIGVTGNSGGGTQAAYIGALDDRVVAAAPSCYITGFDSLLVNRIADDVEQNIHGQLSFGMDHADFLMMRAPNPTLVCAATDDYFRIEGAWEMARRAKRLFGRLGYPERVDIVEAEESHGFHRVLRETAVGWMVRWLRGEDRNVSEPAEMDALEAADLRATPGGQVLAMDGEQSVYEINEEYADELAAQRASVWEEHDERELRTKIRETVGVSELDDIDAPAVRTIETGSDGAVDVESIVLERNEHVWLPSVRVAPTGEDAPPSLALHEDGKQAAAGTAVVHEAIEDGDCVMMTDIRGFGETAPDPDRAAWDGAFGIDHEEVLAAYRLGTSFVAMRTEDILANARWLVDETDTTEGLRLYGFGSVGIPALHAAALEPQLFADVHLHGMLRSWDDLLRTHGVAHDYADLVHGALEVYDLPDLVGLAEETVTVQNPTRPAI